MSRFPPPRWKAECIIFIMRIIVKAKPLTKKEKIERLNQPRFNFENEEAELDVYKIWVKEPPIGGQANEAITKALAKHFTENI